MSDEEFTYDEPIHQTWIENAALMRKGGFDRMAVYRAVGTQPDEFLPEELVIAATIGETIVKAGKRVIPGIKKALGVDLRPETVIKALEDANPEMSDIFKGATSNIVLKQLQVAVKGGAKLAGGDPAVLDGLPRQAEILNGMLNAAKYYTNNYFNDQVIPQLFAEVQKIFDAPGAVTEASILPVREALDVRLKNTPYWRLVANSSASRAYHYGALKAASLNTLRSYYLSAVIDERTTKICRSLNRREFWVADGLQQVERIASAEGDEIKRFSPWLKFEDVAGKDNNALRDINALVPPFHGNCRTTIVFN